MNTATKFACALIVILVLAGCEATPTPIPFATRPLPAPLPTRSATPIPPTIAPTLVPPTATQVPAIATATETPTTAPTIAPTSAPTSAAAVPPGLYVTGLRTEPNPPLRGTDLVFSATFLNTTGRTQNYKWIVYIFRPDNLTRSLNETTRTETGIPAGASESKSLGNFKLAVGGPCENFVARVAFFDQDNKSVFFMKPDGQIFQHDFTVCALVDIPNYPTQTPRPPTLTPTPAPGVFAIDLRIEPDPPTRTAQLNFFATIVNTTGEQKTYKWVVFVYRPGETRSIGQTTGATNTFAPAIRDVQSAGFWRLGPGGPCEEFVARVAWFDQNNQPIFFVNFDNKVFEKTFTVCP
jgi:hypothetical protein